MWIKCHTSCWKIWSINQGHGIRSCESTLTATGPVWTCMFGAHLGNQPKADFHALICAAFFHFKWMLTIVIFFISADNIKLKYRYIFRIRLHFHWQLGEIFFWCSSLPLRVCVYMRVYIYSASRIGLFHVTLKSVVWIQQIAQTHGTHHLLKG